MFFFPQLEYMDLDEFLNENGIPIEEGGKGGANARTSTTAPSSGSSGGGGRVGGASGPGQGPGPVVGGSCTTGELGSTGLSPADPNTRQSPPPTAEVLVGTGMGVAPHMSSVPQSQPQPPMTVCPPTLSPDDYGADDYSSSSSPESDPHSPSLQVHEPGKSWEFVLSFLSFFSVLKWLLFLSMLSCKVRPSFDFFVI